MPVLEMNETQTDLLAQRDKMVLQHLPLVKAIAVRVRETLPVCVELDDIIHAGVLGLIDAASRFDPNKMVAFSSYAKHRIRGAILDSLRDQDPVSRDLRRQSKQAEAVSRELTGILHRTPSESEVAERMGIMVEHLQHLKLRLQSAGQISASTRGNDQDDLPLPEFPSKPETNPDHLFAHEQMREVIGKAMQTLPARYQQVVQLYYSKQLTMKEIGVALGVNESRVSQIHKGALEKLNAALQSTGISSSRALCE